MEWSTFSESVLVLHALQMVNKFVFLKRAAWSGFLNYLAIADSLFRRRNDAGNVSTVGFSSS